MMRKFFHVSDWLLSGWSFFFRWPVSNARTFRPLGVFLGPLLQMIVFLFFSGLGLLVLNDHSSLWAPAFGFLGLSMLTGFFHEDGLADTADSLGVSKFDSQASLEKIHATFKDPRLGTFGVSALVLFWIFRVAAISQGILTIGLWALICLFSRATSLGLGLYYSSRVDSARSARSSHIMQAVSTSQAFIVLLFVCLFGSLLCFGLSDTRMIQLSHVRLWPFVQGLLFTGVFSFFLLGRLVRRSEALNGDLLGAQACLSEVFITICFLKIL
jgi:adenosylcobinamide-GDP ribazoletransferase